MALQGGRVGLAPRIPYRRAPVGCGQGRVPEDCGRAGIEPGDRGEPPGLVANGLRVGVLVYDLRHVGLLGLLYRLVADAGGLIGCTCKRVGRDDRLDDRVERRRVCDRVREDANRGLYGCLFVRNLP